MADREPELSLSSEPARPASSPPCALESDVLCPRCGAELEWRHSSRQCPACTYKEGCCS